MHTPDRAIPMTSFHGVFFCLCKEGCNRVWHSDDPTDYFAHAQAVLTEGTWSNTLGVENNGKSKINQYNDRNLGFKVFYHGVVMFYFNLILNYYIFI